MAHGVVKPGGIGRSDLHWLMQVTPPLKRLTDFSSRAHVHHKFLRIQRLAVTTNAQFGRATETKKRVISIPAARIQTTEVFDDGFCMSTATFYCSHEQAR